MADRATITATAFGLDISSDVPLSFLGGATAKPTGRPLTVSTHREEAARASWPADAELICDERLGDGGVNFQIEGHPTAGYLISGPTFGAHRLSGDGGRAWCFPEGQPDGGWQRMLIAQVLPFAALLHGLEIFHASAVEFDGKALAFLGPSGSGKTSTMLELCRRGANFMADDVLALEPADGKLLAHPGSPVAGVERSALEDTEGNGRGPILATNARERILAMRGAAQPAELSALFVLDRRVDGPDMPEFRPTGDAMSLFSATFNFVLATPERLRGLLDVCALAAQLRVDLISSGPATGVAALVDAIEQRLDPR